MIRSRVLRWMVLIAAAGLLAVPRDAAAQQNLAVTQLQLRYRVLRRATQLDEAKAAQLGQLEESVLAARARGEQGLVFRDLAKAVALLEGKPWSAADEFLHSLAVATDMTVCDPAIPFVARIAQIFPASRGELAISARASLRPLPAARGNGARVRPIGEFTTLPADLLFTPFRFQADLAELTDGPYELTVELLEAGNVRHRLTAPIYVAHGLTTARTAIEPRLQKISGHDDVRASIRYPFDLARVLNLGQTDPVPFDFAGAIAKSQQLLGSLEAGRDPFANERGNLARHYVFQEAGEIMPYRVYVPKSYDGTKVVPLIVALHGLGGTENTFMQQGNGGLPRLAEEHGFIVVTPLGYRRNGGYGRLGGGAAATLDPLTARMTLRSEADVMNVLELVRAHYRIDPNRTYLMGHSMGGNGTWLLGSKHAEIWAALGPIAGGSVSPGVAPLAKLKEQHVPVICVHGDADGTAPVEASRAMIAELKKLGVEHEYVEVKGGTHGSVVGPNLQRIVEFFLRHQRGPAPSS